MSKLLFILFLVGQISCSQSIKKEIELKNGISEFVISPPSNSSTMCRIEISGSLDCDIELDVHGNGTICIKKGEVDYWRNYEWYNESKKIKIRAKDNCIQNSNFKARFRFTSQYFGKGASEKEFECE